MLIAIHSFGSIWSARLYTGRIAYYNTTGILVGDTVRRRSCSYGYVRMNATLGFRPETSQRMANRVFECEPPGVWTGQRKLFIRGAAHVSAVPESYLIALDSDNIGRIDRRGSWICNHGSVLSFSEGNGKQQVLVLLPAYGWIQTATGTRYVIPRIGARSQADLVER